MGYLVLARKYRPRTFAELVGQDHVVRTLSNSIAEGRLAHAFLFVGPRGIGKTSTARILAKALNCPQGPKTDFNPDDDICKEIEEGRSLDVLEIDGASNRGINEIKELRDSVPYAPAPIINNHATVQLRLAAAALTPCLQAACVLRALQPCICMRAL